MKRKKRLLFVVLALVSVTTFAQQNSIGNPIIPGYFADPSVIADNNKFY